MGTVKYCCCIAIAIGFVVLAEGAALRKSDLFSIMKHIPSSDKKEFVRYHLNKGYEVSQKKESGRYPTFSYKLNDDEALSFYEYYAANNAITDQKELEELQDIICWNNLCIDFGDPGIHP